MNCDFDQLFDLVKKLHYIPCPYAFGKIHCGIFNPCAARVLRKVEEDNNYQCYYIEAPIADELIAVNTIVGLFSMFVCETDLIEDLKEIACENGKKPKTDKEYFLFASSRLGELIQKRDACISCIYRSEQSKRTTIRTTKKVKKTVRKTKRRVGTHKLEGKGKRRKKRQKK